MDFYKLTDFQLYSIINSRHLDKESREQAERELQRRNLSEEDMKKLAKELLERTNATPSFLNWSPNVLLLVAFIILLVLFRQCS